MRYAAEAIVLIGTLSLGLVITNKFQSRMQMSKVERANWEGDMKSLEQLMNLQQWALEQCGGERIGR